MVVAYDIQKTTSLLGDYCFPSSTALTAKGNY